MRLLILLAAYGLVACGDDGTSPEGQGSQTLPEGTYSVTYTACQSCDPLNTPGTLLTFSVGVESEVVISEASADTAVLTLVSMLEGGSGDVLRFAEDSTIVIEFGEFASTQGPAYRGATSWGCCSTFFPIFWRDGDGIGCDFALFNAEHDVGATTCTVN